MEAIEIIRKEGLSIPVRRGGKEAIESVRTILAKLMKRVFYESIRTQSTTISANISG
jgi:hypothetical protein